LRLSSRKARFRRPGRRAHLAGEVGSSRRSAVVCAALDAFHGPPLAKQNECWNTGDPEGVRKRPRGIGVYRHDPEPGALLARELREKALHAARRPRVGRREEQQHRRVAARRQRGSSLGYLTKIPERRRSKPRHSAQGGTGWPGGEVAISRSNLRRWAKRENALGPETDPALASPAVGLPGTGPKLPDPAEFGRMDAAASGVPSRRQAREPHTTSCSPRVSPKPTKPSKMRPQPQRPSRSSFPAPERLKTLVVATDPFCRPTASAPRLSAPDLGDGRARPAQPAG
jgi:hypothetical protein